MDPPRNVGRGARGLDLAAQPVGVVSLVGQNDSSFVQMPEQVLGDWAISGLVRNPRRDRLNRVDCRA